MMLDGIRVLEMGQNVAGPHAAQILGDLGAEVIKIERPGGEEGRKLGPPFAGEDAAWFHQINRNKKSVTIDIKDEAQRAQFVALIGTADVFLQNMRPGVLANFGLGPEEMRALYPALIYADVAAFGRTGPLAGRPGYELLMQAYGGLMSITGDENAPPTRLGPSMVDLGTGMWAVIGILSALHRRSVTGEGATVDCSLFETAIGFSGIHMVNYLASGTMPARSANGFAGLAPYGGFPTADDDIIIGGGNDRLFTRLADVLGHPEWAADPRFQSNVDRVANRTLLTDAIASITRSYPAAALLAKLEAAGIPCAPIRTIPQLTQDAQVAALGMIDVLPGPDPHPVIRLPLSFDGKRPAVTRASPRPGADNMFLDNLP
jgi:crotonobetainyl-CoA:carnitine CoA-transferase CaiB-like acyl-CoA transferase